MKITALILELEKIKEREGDIEVTCTGTDLSDSNPSVFETTVEHLVVEREGFIVPRVRLWM